MMGLLFGWFDPPVHDQQHYSPSYTTDKGFHWALTSSLVSDFNRFGN
jgi:hypothetical protein